MKKTYMQPAIVVMGVEAATLMAGSGTTNQATYGGGDNGDKNSHTDNIGIVGDGDDFTMEAKKNNGLEWGGWE